MSVPGFTAEAALYRRGDQNYVGRATATVAPSQGVIPQSIDCDIYIFCQDGIRYLKRDCPDGSGDTTRIGVCQSHPWWWYLISTVAIN